MAVTIKSKEEIQCMRDAGKILAEVHEKLAEIIAPGITSLEIDRKVTVKGAIISASFSCTSAKILPASRIH